MDQKTYTHFRKNISRHYTSFRKTLQGWNQRKGRSTVVVILMNFVLFVIGFVIENIEKIVAVWQKLYLIRNRNSSHCTRNKLVGRVFICETFTYRKVFVRCGKFMRRRVGKYFNLCTYILLKLQRFIVG